MASESAKSFTTEKSWLASPAMVMSSMIATSRRGAGNGGGWRRGGMEYG